MRPVYLSHIDPLRNRRRWYAIRVQRDLFGAVWLICRWGRLGHKGGTEMTIAAASVEQAEARCRNIIRQKSRRGYRAARIEAQGELF